MTIQTLFNRMMALHNTLALGTSGDDVARGLAAVNMAEDWFELEAAKYSNFLRYSATLTTTANTETTAWPTALLRLDSLWLLNSSSLPVRELEKVDAPGGHISGGTFDALTLGVATSFGAPQGYDTDGVGGFFYWSPIPDAIYTLRAYGLWLNTEYTAVGDTFAYIDQIALVIAPAAVRIMLVGHGRKLTDIQAEESKNFKALIEGLRKSDRTTPDTKYYSEFHTT